MSMSLSEYNMAAAVSDFEPWLFEKLRKLNTDEGVFGSYITSILEGEDSLEEKNDALEGLLSEIVEKDISSLVAEILEKWESCQPKVETLKPVTDVDAQLARLLDTQKLATTTTTKSYTDEEKKIREAILSQYSQLPDNEEEEENDEAGDGPNLVKNTNAADVHAAARERREQSRLDAQKKKEKDKEDREKQKQLKEEKKEKRKTQKGERKR